MPVADPAFSRGGAPTLKLGLFCKFFAENCMKMKEFGPGDVPDANLEPPMDAELWQNSCVKKWSPFHHDEHSIFYVTATETVRPSPKRQQLLPECPYLGDAPPQL